MENFEKMRADLIAVLKTNSEFCSDGLAQLSAAQDVMTLYAIGKKFWSWFNCQLWKETQSWFHTYYKDTEAEANAIGIYYNTSCDSGLCLVDEYAGEGVEISGRAEAIVHDAKMVKVSGQAHASLMGKAVAVAYDSSRVDARDESFVTAYNFVRVRAFDNARVVSDGATDINIYGTSECLNIKSHKMNVGVNAKIVSERWDKNKL